jgi:hypothetical protein
MNPLPDYVTGYFERFEGMVAVGWVADRRQADRRLAVELWLDGEPAVVGMASIYRGDVESAGVGDGRYGFRLMVPDHLAPVERTKASVRIANTLFVLPGSPQWLEPGQDEVTAVRGEVNQQAGLAVRGWAYDERHPDRQFTVELLDGEDVVAFGIADRFRRDLLDNGIGDGRHAFEIKLPMRFADGRHHILSCRIAETGDMLSRDGIEVLEMTSARRPMPASSPPNRRRPPTCCGRWRPISKPTSRACRARSPSANFRPGAGCSTIWPVPRSRMGRIS